MSDWLSVIEEDTERMLELSVVPPFLAFYEGRRRMARVIRELVTILDVICQLKDIDLASWSDLSPDAKELLK